jgi:hypothetical protein
MHQSPSWAAYRFSATQKSPRILWNPKVHYCIHKRPSPVPILSHIKPVQTTELISWRSILILSSHLSLCLPSNFFSLRFSHQNTTRTSPVPRNLWNVFAYICIYLRIFVYLKMFSLKVMIIHDLPEQAQRGDGGSSSPFSTWHLIEGGVQQNSPAALPPGKEPVTIVR